MKGMTVEIVASSWIEALGGLSRWVTRRLPPAFCAKEGALLATTKTAAMAATVPRISFPPVLCWLDAITFEMAGVESHHEENARFAGRNGRLAGAARCGTGLPLQTHPHHRAVRAGHGDRHRGARDRCGDRQAHRPGGGDRE